MFSWKFEEAHGIIDSWGEEKHLQALIYRSRLFNHQGYFDKALEVINKAITISEANNDIFHKFYGIALKSNILAKLGKTDEIEIIFDLGIKMIKDFDADLKRNTIWAQAYFYNYYAIHLMLNGDMKEAIATFNHVISLQSAIEDIRGLASTRQNIGLYYKIIGDFDKAKESYNASREYYLTLKYDYGIANVLSNIGDILRIQGKLVEAKDHLLRAIETFLTVDGNPNPHVIANAYQRIGRIHTLLNDTDHAKWNFIKAVEAIEGGYHPVTFGEISFDLILLMMKIGDQKEEEIWFKKLQKLNDDYPENKVIELLVKFIRGIKFTKSSNRLEAIAKAETLFLEIIEGEIISHEITVLAMIQYLEILFIEMRVLQNQDIMDQIQKYLRTILEIATQQKSIILMIETHILKSSVALLTLNMEAVNEHLEAALSLAKNHDIVFLISKIEKEQNSAFKYINSIDKQLEDQSSLSSRIDEIDIKGYLDDVSKVVRS